ncbi:hypothetical protein ACLOJK_004652 [Asimina triloba]
MRGFLRDAFTIIEPSCFEKSWRKREAKVTEIEEQWGTFEESDARRGDLHGSHPDICGIMRIQLRELLEELAIKIRHEEEALKTAKVYTKRRDPKGPSSPGLRRARLGVF